MKLKPNFAAILEAIRDGREFLFIYSHESLERKKSLAQYKLRLQEEWQI